MSENVSRVGAGRSPSPTREELAAPADTPLPAHDRTNLDEAAQLQLSDHSENVHPAGEENTANSSENADEPDDSSMPSNEDEFGCNPAADDLPARAEISLAPRPTSPPNNHQVVTGAQKRQIMLERAMRGMRRDPWYLYRLSERRFQKLVGMPRSRLGKTFDDIKRICKHLRGCKIYPSAVILEHGRLCARHLRVAKRKPKPRPSSSPLRQAWIADDFELFVPRGPGKEDQKNISFKKLTARLTADPNLKAHFIKSVFPVLTSREEPKLPADAEVSEGELEARTKAPPDELSNATRSDDMGLEELVETGPDPNSTALLDIEIKAKVSEYDENLRDYGDPGVGVESPQLNKHDQSPDIAFPDPNTPSATTIPSTEIPDNSLASSAHVASDLNKLAAPGQIPFTTGNVAVPEVLHSETSLGPCIHMVLDQKAPADAPQPAQETNVQDFASPHPSKVQDSATIQSLTPENDHLAELEPLDEGLECPRHEADLPSESVTTVGNQQAATLSQHSTPIGPMLAAENQATPEGTAGLHSEQSTIQLTNAGAREVKSAGGLEELMSKRRRIARSSWAGTPLPSLMAPLKPIKRKASHDQKERTSKRLRSVRDSCTYNTPDSDPTVPSLSSCQLDGVFDDMPRRLRRALAPRPDGLGWPNNIPSRHNRFGSSEQPQRDPVDLPYMHAAGETDIGDRYEDGEVRRYGAGESYRPFNNRDRERSPRGTRSPPRERARTPPGGSDSYVPGRSPRRRSRSADRFRYRDRSREREGGDVWRRGDRSRSRARSPARRSSPLRRSPPRRSPRRYPSPKRNDRAERARSPRRDYDARDIRRRSRSPYDRDWAQQRNSSPPRRGTPGAFRGGSYRPRSRSPERRDDRYNGSSYRRPSPPRESLDSSGMTSRSASRRSSPRPGSNRGRDDRSRPQSPTRSPNPAAAALPTSLPVREPLRQPTQEAALTPAKSPPRGPAALRQPPLGPSASRNLAVPVASPNLQGARHSPSAGPSPRADMTSPTIPPAGPRGYVPPRGGGFTPRGGRGGWPSMPGRHMPGPSVSPTIPPTGPSSIPTGPRAVPSSGSGPSPSLSSNKPFNPPTGPASLHSNAPRPTLAHNLVANMPPIIPGGKLDPSLTPLTTGVVKELESHHRKLKEEEERVREEMKSKQEKLRKSLRVWDKLERESKAFELKSDLSEKSLKNLAGEGLGGAAF